MSQWSNIEKRRKWMDERTKRKAEAGRGEIEGKIRERGRRTENIHSFVCSSNR